MTAAEVQKADGPADPLESVHAELWRILEAEAERQGRDAKQAHMQRLALASSRARRKVS